MTRIALTGGIACGKSLAGRMMADRGIPVCEADEIGHLVLAEDDTVRTALFAEFGAALEGPAGRIDRGVLGRLVFGQPEKLARLNAITHPAIMRRVMDWMDRQAGLAVATIPLLYEIGAEGGWDRVICVAAPEADQLRRLGERGLDPAAARARIAAQMPLAVKMERADYVIYNCGSTVLLEEQVNQVLRTIRGA